jgi:hypothetical protein
MKAGEKNSRNLTLAFGEAEDYLVHLQSSTRLIVSG